MQIIRPSKFPLISSGGYNQLQVQRAVVTGRSPVQYSGGALYGLGADPEKKESNWPLIIASVLVVAGLWYGGKKGWL